MSILDLMTSGMPPREAAALRDQLSLPAVLDASAIIDDLLYRTGPGARLSALQLSLLLGVLRPFGKLDLLDEVESRLPEIAAKERRDLAKLRELLGEYTRELRLVDVTGLRFDDTDLRAIERENPDDAPSARLKLLLDPALLLTRDNDLLRHGFGVWLEDGAPAKWSHAAVTARDAAAPLSVGAMGLLGALITQLIAALLDDLATTYPRFTALAAALAALGFLGAVASPKWRSDWRPAIAERLKGTLAAVGRIIEPYPDALQQLADYRRSHPGAGSDLAFVARTLALAPARGLLLSELKAVARDAAPSLRGVLSSYVAFQRTDRWRWTLGTGARDVE
jgi:VIT1/CCC1 family predicted Fe2+/Mn2+ transporter